MSGCLERKSVLIVRTGMIGPWTCALCHQVKWRAFVGLGARLAGLSVFSLHGMDDTARLAWYTSHVCSHPVGFADCCSSLPAHYRTVLSRVTVLGLVVET